jgi:hypothetical protein
MNPNRSHILSQLASGEISADQAAERLRGGAGAASASQPVPPALTNRWLRIRVTDLNTGRARVNVNLPMSWVAIGLRIGSRYSDELNNLDLPQILSAIEAGTAGQIVDVEDLEDGQRVQIFVD